MPHACDVLPRKLDDEIYQRLRAVHVWSDFGVRVPGKAHVQILEDAVADHICLAGHGLLSRCSVKPYRSFELAFGDQIFYRKRRAETGSPEKVATPIHDRGRLLLTVP